MTSFQHAICLTALCLSGSLTFGAPSFMSGSYAISRYNADYSLSEVVAQTRTESFLDVIGFSHWSSWVSHAHYVALVEAVSSGTKIEGFCGTQVMDHDAHYVVDTYYGTASMNFTFRLDRAYSYRVEDNAQTAWAFYFYYKPIIVPSWASMKGGVLKPGVYTVSGSASENETALNFVLNLTPFDGFVGDAQRQVTPINPMSSVAEPVDTAGGTYYSELSLVRINGAREISLDLKYDSRLLGASVLGAGWSHDFESSVVSYGDNVILQMDANRFNNFVATVLATR